MFKKLINYIKTKVEERKLLKLQRSADTILDQAENINENDKKELKKFTDFVNSMPTYVDMENPSDVTKIYIGRYLYINLLLMNGKPWSDRALAFRTLNSLAEKGDLFAQKTLADLLYDKNHTDTYDPVTAQYWSKEYQKKVQAL